MHVCGGVLLKAAVRCPSDSIRISQAKPGQQCKLHKGNEKRGVSSL